MIRLLMVTGGAGVLLALVVLAVVVRDLVRDRRARPYLNARWDDIAGAWVNEEPYDVGPDPLRLLTDLETHLKAYGAEIADLYEPVRTGDHTTNPTGDPK